jgi:mono/diheme cytochrome c family protein
MRNFILGAAVAPLTFAAVALLCAALGLVPVASDVDPGPLETRLFSSAVHASVRRAARTLPAPPPVTDSLLIAGGKLYRNDCIGCHSIVGKPASRFGQTFYPRAPQFADVGTTYSLNEAYWVAKHGLRMTGMSSKGDDYRDASLYALTAYITHMKHLPPAVAAQLAKPEQ